MTKQLNDCLIKPGKKPEKIRLGANGHQSLSLNGLYFISLRNNNNKPFIPSIENYFGGIQIRKVLCDTGCNTFLLPLEENQLHEVFKKFSDESHFKTITTSTNVGGKSPVLNIAKIDGSPFEVSLCQDLIDSEAIIHVKSLRFHLCSDDVLEILDSSLFTDILCGLNLLVEDSINYQGRKRKTNAILGQSIMKNLSSMRSSNIEFFVDQKYYDIESWREIEILSIRIVDKICFPDCFKDWQDDENVGLDAGEDYECSD